jgi:oligopeptide/dipeptide ABC transporter ATP-binding protein
VSDVSFDVRPGQIMGLIGESGSGKTMSCRAIAGALPRGISIASGSVDIGATTLRAPGRSPDRMIARRVGMVFADPHASLDPLQRIGDQISEVGRVSRGLTKDGAREQTMRLLGQVSLPDPERVYRLFPFELSGGMAQRAMIASVLAGGPDFILADEPTSALDATVQLEIIDLLVDLTQEESVGILLTTHDIAVAARACATIGVMYAGKLVEHGATTQVLQSPRHPYTALLMRARPRGRRTTRLEAIPGEPPVPGTVQTACPFAPRCPRAQPVCATEEPKLVDGVACHFPLDPTAERQAS